MKHHQQNNYNMFLFIFTHIFILPLVVYHCEIYMLRIYNRLQ